MDRERKGGAKGFVEMCRPMVSKMMAGRRGFGYLLMIPGVLLILGGVLIFTAPRVLVWLIAGTSIVTGVVILFFAIIMRKLTARWGEGATASEMPAGEASGCAG